MSDSTFIFDLLISPEGGGYRARVLSSPGGQADRGFELPDPEALLGDFGPTAGTRVLRPAGPPPAEQRQALGERLFRAVFAEEVLTRLETSRLAADQAGERLQVRLRLAEVPELAVLPWELLYDPARAYFLALSEATPVVRFLEVAEVSRSLAVTPPLRIAGVVAAPLDLEALDGEREWSLLEEALGRPGTGVELARVEAPTLAALEVALRKGGYHVLHFVGHGSVARESGEGALHLAGPDGKARAAGGVQLEATLRDRKTLRLVFLNACRGGQGSAGEAFAGIAHRLVRAGVPAVLAMQRPITDAAATLFSATFYRALAAGEPVDGAVTLARRVLFTEGHADEWDTPVLFLRAPAVPLCTRTLATGSESEPSDALRAVTPVFTGREVDVSGVVAALAEHRLVTVTGLGGIGKSEVAKAVARAARGEAWCREGVHYLDLASAASADAVLTRLTGELGLQPAAATDGIARQLAGAKLYVLDDLHPSLSAERRKVVEMVRDLLVGSGDARFLVTSRDPINVAGQGYRYRLHRLPAPADAELFRRLAEGAGCPWADGDEARLVTLVRELDGYPLALTLAAELLSDFTLAEVLDRWNRRRTEALKVPGIEMRDLDRFTSVEYSLSLSYDTLPEGPAGSLFALCADMPAGATLDLLRDVMGEEAEEAVDALNARSLVHREEGRWRMLTPVREFAARTRTLEVEPLRHRLDAALAVLAEHWGNEIIRDTSTAVRAFTMELPNLYSALDRAAQQGNNEYVVRVTLAFFGYYPSYAPSAEAIRRLEAAVASAQAIGDLRGEANCRHCLGNVHHMLDQFAPARENFETARRLTRDLGIPEGEAYCLLFLGEMYRLHGEDTAARERYSAALTLFRTIEDGLGEANCLVGLGEMHRMSGENAAARELLEPALELNREIGNRLGEANCLQSLGHVNLALGDYLSARGYYEEAMALSRDLGHRLGEANGRESLGDVFRLLGEYGAARDQLNAALALNEEIGNRLGQASCSFSLGCLYWAETDRKMGIAWMERAAKLFEDIGITERAEQTRAMVEWWKAVFPADGTPSSPPLS